MPTLAVTAPWVSLMTAAAMSVARLIAAPMACIVTELRVHHEQCNHIVSFDKAKRAQVEPQAALTLPFAAHAELGPARVRKGACA